MKQLPKIAVPIIARGAAEIIESAKTIAASRADLAEWRVDFYEELRDEKKVTALAAQIRGILGEKELLLTCRTKNEGGEAELSAEAYRGLLRAMAGQAALLDAELAMSEPFLREITALAHAQHTQLVLSYHNFSQTPSETELMQKYAAMRENGGDYLKIAVMPRTDADVDRMIRVARRAAERFEKPIIAIVMGERGQCTRIACEAIGSQLTFGTLGGASAPGQLDANVLGEMLAGVHQNIEKFHAAETAEQLRAAIRDILF